MNKKYVSLLLAAILVMGSVFVGGITKADAATVISVKESAGYEEAVYAEWDDVSGADGYRAYVSADGVHYSQVDNELIRKYDGYWRVDAVGLAAGTYSLKIEAVKKASDGSVSVLSDEVKPGLVVVNYDRSGFAFSGDSIYGTGSGAYNDDGTLKSNAQVIYVTPETAKTCTATVGGKKIVGFQNILDAKQKANTSNDILDFRIIGCIKDSDLDKMSSSSEGLQIKGKSAYERMNITIEGIGEDACIKGFGMLIRNSGNVEIRNIGLLQFMDDGISVDTENTNIWIHDCDVFYGKPGSESDQGKGDGSIDLKGDSKWITVAYNHFVDSGKSSLCGMKSESGPNYITYHHNWFDHSDSRHPRIRTMSVHVYNNYYDGNSKYGVGAAEKSDAFVESNYFNNCKYPMLSSMQGTDIYYGAGTFSGENGGIIKAYNNKVVGASRLVYANSDNGTVAADSVQFDAVYVSSRNEVVPSSYAAVKGGHTYNNFDTNVDLGVDVSAIDAVDDVPSIVKNKAGRLNGGDLKWTFTDADDADYSINEGLKAAVVGYESSLKSVGGLETAVSGGGVQTPTQAPTQTPGGTTGGTGGTGGTATGKVEHTFDVATSSFFAITGSTSNSKGTVTYGGRTLRTCLKMESATKIGFSINSDAKLIMVFGDNVSKKIKVNGNNQNIVNGILELDLTAGSYLIEKKDAVNLFYIAVEYNETATEAPTDAATEAPTNAATDVPTNVPINEAESAGAGGSSTASGDSSNLFIWMLVGIVSVTLVVGVCLAGKNTHKE